MSIRVTAAEVKSVFDTSASNIVVTEHINIASRLVDDLLSSTDLSANRLRDIELYLAAHFTAIFDPDNGMANEKAIGSARNRYDYQSQLGKSLELTRFGQMAIMLDTTSTLAKTGGKKALFSVFGTS